jgi:PAS domain S-box-containing protein
MRETAEIDRLRRENDLLRTEVRVAREAANITASAVVRQFEETERALGRLSELSAQQRAVLDAATQVAVIATDRQGIIRLFNTGAENLLGYRAEEVLGKHTPTLFHLEEELRGRARVLEQTLGHALGALEYFFACAERDRSEVLEWTLVRKDGTTFPVDESVTPLRGVSGELTGFLCVALDLSVHKRAEQEIRAAMEATEAANRTKSAFLANMSHELRTPLNAVIGYSEMLLEEATEEGLDMFVEDLSKIRSAGQHLLGVINDILDISKIEAGRVDLCLERFEVRDLVAEVGRMALPLSEKNQNELVTTVAEDVGVMASDPLRVRQILFNLLGNACKFTERGRVELRVEVIDGLDADRIRFQVVDSGIGMTQEQVDKIFQPFVQADASTTRRFGGTGLGLAISQQLAGLLGGAITVQSTIGVGTRFQLELPRVAPLGGGRPVEPAMPGPARRQESSLGSVLVIDDDETVRDLLGHHLRHGGYQVTFATNGEEGLRMARELRPDVITLDVLMPEKDGWRVLSELKASPETAPIPVVMLTILDQRSAGFALGAADYLLKPIDRTRLLQTLHRLCARAEGTASVLVVDDDDSVRALLSQQLERAGYVVREASHGGGALRRVEEAIPDAILLDLMMPVMDGFAFLDALRARPEWQSIPVVVVTAMDLADSQRAALRSQVEQVLTKTASGTGDYPASLIREVLREIEGAARQRQA